MAVHIFEKIRAKKYKYIHIWFSIVFRMVITSKWAVELKTDHIKAQERVNHRVPCGWARSILHMCRNKFCFPFFSDDFNKTTRLWPTFPRSPVIKCSAEEEIKWSILVNYSTMIWWQAVHVNTIIMIIPPKTTIKRRIQKSNYCENIQNTRSNNTTITDSNNNYLSSSFCHLQLEL